MTKKTKTNGTTTAVSVGAIDAKRNNRVTEGLSISLPTELAQELRGLMTSLVPGLELGLSDVARFVVTLGLAAHRARYTATDFPKLDGEGVSP